MDFRFLHAADIHLDSPLRGLALRAESQAGRFVGASRRAFENLVAAAIDRQVAFVVVAGDLFDGDWKDFGTGLFFAEQMGVLDRAGIPVFLVYGNHDAETVIRRRLSWPGNVTAFDSRGAETVTLDGLRVSLHGRSYPRPDLRDNIALDYPPPRPGWFNIGILHTACEGREGHLPYAPCSLSQLVHHGYDYWALGHVHQREILHRHPHVVFPGNLQGRHSRETGPKGATLVTVVDGQVSDLEALVLDEARFASIELDPGLHGSLDEVLAAFRDALPAVAEAAGERPVALRLQLAGDTRLHADLAADPARLRAQVQATALAVSDQIWVERVQLDTRDPIGARLGERGDVLGELAHLLDEAAADPELRERLTAELRGLRARLPQGGIAHDELPAVDRLDDILAAGRALVVGRLRGEGPR